MNFKLIFRSAAALALVIGARAFAATQQDHVEIIGGDTVHPGDPVASSTVLIVGDISASKQYICTGSLIAPDMVVTAAHCVADDIKAPTKPEKIFLVFGLSVPTSAAQHTPIARAANYVYNPGWKGQAAQGADEHDIAVIHFDGELPPGYAPATLLDPNVVLKPGTDVTLAGYGEDTTTGSGNNGAGILRKVSGVPVLKALGQTEVVLDQRSGIGACHGDSGGPAFLAVDGKNYLWGVTNRGYPDSAPDNCIEESVYTRITAYSDFISKAEDSLRSQKVAEIPSAPRGRQNRTADQALGAASDMGIALSAQ